MVYFYILSPLAISHVEKWFQESFTKFLFPSASLTSQRCSEALQMIGREYNCQAFLKAHINYILSILDGPLKGISDTICESNLCTLCVTKINKYVDNISIEFRLVIVIELRTGLPIYFYIVPENVIDKNITDKIVEELKEYNLQIDHILYDADCLTKEVTIPLFLSGIGFLTRFSVNLNLLNDIYNKYSDSIVQDENLVKCNDIFIYILEVNALLVIDSETDEAKECYIYLCKDIKQCSMKTKALFESDEFQNLTADEFFKLSKIFGSFALISMDRISNHMVLPRYYMRQGAGQCIDYIKNSVKMMPICVNIMDFVRGHIMLRFINTFINIIIKNRLDILDCNYVAIPNKICENDDLSNYDAVDIDGYGTFIKQQTILPIFRKSTQTLFSQLRRQRCRVYQSTVKPDYPIKQAKNFYSAFGMSSPTVVESKANGLKYKYDGDNPLITKALVFSQRQTVTEDYITSKGKKHENAPKEEHLGQ